MKNTKYKFRFWDKALNEMCFRKPAYNDFTHKDIIPLAFTGFKDCNGVEIYEGDTLVDVDVTLEENVKLEDTMQQVYWSAKYGCWKLDSTFLQNKKRGFALAKDLKDFRFMVSGNVFKKEKSICKCVNPKSEAVKNYYHDFLCGDCLMPFI